MAINKILIRPDNPAAVSGEWTSLQINSADGGLKFISVKEASSTATGIRNMVQIASKTIGGAALHAGVLSWVNPEAGNIAVIRVDLDVTTVATGAAKIDIGATAVSATTAADNLVDGIDVNAAVGIFGKDSGDGTNGITPQRVATGKWVTFKEISGDVTGLVATAYIHYYPVA